MQNAAFQSFEFGIFATGDEVAGVGFQAQRLWGLDPNILPWQLSLAEMTMDMLIVAVF